MKDILKKAAPVRDFLIDHNDFVIIADYDCDGTTSAAIMATTLDRLGKIYSIYQTRSLEESLSTLAKNGDHFIFLDQGSGQVPLIERYGRNFAICDHHETLFDTDQPHFNSHLVGLDGNKEVCAAGMTYLASKAVDANNVDLSAIAVVGAIGDLQDISGRLVGMNQKIVEDAVDAGVHPADKLAQGH